MQEINTTKTASLNELREPSKVLAFGAGNAVAIMDQNACVAYLVPYEAVEDEKPVITGCDFGFESKEDVKSIVKRRLNITQPGLNYLRGK